MAERPTLEVSDEPATAAARALAERLDAYLATQDRVRLAIPGGSALQAVPHARQALGERWSRVALTWVDERCVPESDAESNRGAARSLGVLDDPAPCHVVPLYLDGETPAAAAKHSEAELRAHFGGALDVLLLGLGEDGHIASLFPLHPDSRPASPPADRHSAKPELVMHVTDSPKPPADRLSLTRVMLATAGASVLLATGAGKRDALERLLAGDETLPAHGLEGLHVVTDQEMPG